MATPRRLSRACTGEREKDHVSPYLSRSLPTRSAAISCDDRATTTTHDGGLCTYYPCCLFVCVPTYRMLGCNTPPIRPPMLALACVCPQIRCLSNATTSLSPPGLFASSPCPQPGFWVGGRGASCDERRAISGHLLLQPPTSNSSACGCLAYVGTTARRATSAAPPFKAKSLQGLLLSFVPIGSEV